MKYLPDLLALIGGFSVGALLIRGHLMASSLAMLVVAAGFVVLHFQHKKGKP